MADDARNASGTPAPTASHAGHSGGHVVSSRATAVGLMAIVLWSFMAGTVRIVAESFGATLGSALIYTVGGVLLLVFRRPAPIREFPKKYLIIGGLLFVFYESSISLSLGLASTAASSVEVSLVNYLWPTMMVLLAAGVSRRRHAVWKVLPGAIVATVGVALAVGGNSGLDWQAAAGHIADNPLPYVLAFAGALAWSVYAVFTPAWSHGVDGTSVFFPCVAVALWIIHFASGQGWPQSRRVWSHGCSSSLRLPQSAVAMPAGATAFCTARWSGWPSPPMPRWCSPLGPVRCYWDWRYRCRSGAVRCWWPLVRC